MTFILIVLSTNVSIYNKKIIHKSVSAAARNRKQLKPPSQTDDITSGSNLNVQFFKRQFSLPF